VSGSGTLFTSGNGTVNLQAANTHTGDARIVSGTMNLANADALQASTLDMNAADAGTVGFTAGSGVYNVAGLKGSRGITFSSGTLSVGSNNASTTYSGILAGTGRLAKVGSAVLTIEDANSYSGGTLVSDGSLTGNASSLQGAITNNAEVKFAQATAGTYAGAMTGSGSVTKTGAGSLTMSGNSSYAGPTSVTAGSLVINGNNSGATGPINLSAGTTLAGSGTHGGAIAIVANTTLSPGNSPGTFTAASGTWASGGNYNWQLFDAAGTAGSTWDLLDITGGLDITATSGSPFLLNLWTLSGTGPDVNGSATNFNSNASYTWRIATAAGGVTGFAANKFQVNTGATNGTAGFANSFGSGQPTVANTGNDVNLVFTPAVVFDVTSGTQTQAQLGNADIATAVSVSKTGAGSVVMNGNNT